MLEKKILGTLKNKIILLQKVISLTTNLDKLKIK